MIGNVISNYKIVSQIGEGGMGSVYLGEHIHLSSRKVAIKVLHRQMLSNAGIRQRFRNEAATLSQIDHENIVKIFDYIESEEGFFLIMEFVEGMTLEDYILNVSGPLNEERAIQVMAKMLNGFGFAHQRGIIHRDVKPSNIIVSNDLSVVKILDFGVAKLLTENSNMTKHGTQMGTVYYMSPEQVKGLQVDQKSDIYSLGISLFQMVTGVNPYADLNTEFDVFNKIVNEPLPDARTIYPGASQKIVSVIQKATSKLPEDRYPSCESFKADLLNLHDSAPPISTLDGKTIDRPIPVAEEAIEKNPKNKVLLFVFLGIFGIGLLGVLLNMKKIQDYFKWNDAELKYCIVSSLRMRSDTTTYSDYNIIPVSLEFGQSFKVLPLPIYEPWVEAKVDDQVGYVNGKYLMNSYDFNLLKQMLDTEGKLKEIYSSKYRKSLVEYVKSNYNLPSASNDDAVVAVDTARAIDPGVSTIRSGNPTLMQIYYDKFIKTGSNRYYNRDYAVFLLVTATSQEIVVFVYENDEEIGRTTFEDVENITEEQLDDFLGQYGLDY